MVLVHCMQRADSCISRRSRGNYLSVTQVDCQVLAEFTRDLYMLRSVHVQCYWLKSAIKHDYEPAFYVCNGSR